MLKVAYYRRCEEWHPKSLPFIVDENGDEIALMHQNMGHPGEYDEKAVRMAHLFAASEKMLAALKDALGWLDQEGFPTADVEEAIREAEQGDKNASSS